ncbi:MAG: hypothetical protein JW822_06070 [Spirochaetales bacterium]|nr:hypothetical protein [Spirochaetales bacterium]
MQFRTKLAVVLFVTFLVIIVAGYLLSESIEVVKEEVYVGLKGQARTNPFLAAERLLINRDFAVNHIYNEYQLTNFLDNSGTIFFSAMRDSFKTPTLEKLLEWVELGGNLVVNVAPYGDDFENQNHIDFFLEYAGVEVNINPDVDGTAGENGAAEDGIKFTLPGIDKDLAVTLDNYLVLSDTDEWASWAVRDNGHNLLLQFNIGKGLLSIISSLSFIENSLIGENDNAAFFWYLVRQGSSKHEVWFVWRHDVKSFWEILFQYTWMFLISLVVCLLLFMWKQGMRFGPMITITDTASRSLIEHVYASGRFLWNNKQRFQLLASLKQAVIHKIKVKLLVWDTLSTAEQLEHLKQRTELNEEVLNILFIPETREQLSKTSFLTKAQILERIYEKL